MVQHRKDLVSDVAIEPLRRVLSVQPQVRHEHARPVRPVAVPRRADDAEQDEQDRMAARLRQQAGHVVPVRLLDLRQHLLELFTQGRSAQLRSGDADERRTADDDRPAAAQSASPLQGRGEPVRAGSLARQSRVQVRVRLHRQLVRPAVPEARIGPAVRGRVLVVSVQLPVDLSERRAIPD